MIRKAVLPVAGLGTRCLPASKAIPKEMITIVDKPVIQYVVEEAVAAGIKEIVLVTHSSKGAIENHFDKHFELETMLEAKGKDELLAEVRKIIPDDVSIIAVRQPEALGLGHAVLCARSVIGEDEPFAVLLPDVLVDDEGLPRNDLAGMIDAYQRTGDAQIMVENVPRDMVNKYGIVALEGDVPEPGNSALISDMVEKPKVEEAPSTLAVTNTAVRSAASASSPAWASRSASSPLIAANASPQAACTGAPTPAASSVTVASGQPAPNPLASSCSA